MICILLALSRPTGVIGKDGKLPWKLPDDLFHFKKLTLGHPVIVGRKTFEGLPKLAGRQKIVVSRRARPARTDREVVWTSTLSEATYPFTSVGTSAYLIGGGELALEAIKMPCVTHMYLTEILLPFEGDTFFRWQEDAWDLLWKSPVYVHEKIPFQFCTYFRHAQNPHAQISACKS